MIPAPCATTAPVPPPAYHRAQAQVGPALQVEALTVVSRRHLLAVGRRAVRLARRRGPPRSPAVARWPGWPAPPVPRGIAAAVGVAAHAVAAVVPGPARLAGGLAGVGR
jgi:hypothetical protein